MKGITIEVCCGSVDDVIQAKEAGAARVELNSCLFLGGLTPSLGEIRLAKKTGMEIMAMVRPRGGGFCYTNAEFETMLADTEIFVNEGADGIVFGILKPDGTIDEKRCAQIIKLIGNKQIVFHRAIDVVPDWKSSLDVLVNLGVKRVLTSGQHTSAHYGKDVIKDMVQHAGGRIEILAGCGFNTQNIREITEKTGVDQLHLSAFKTYNDTSAHSNQAIFFGGALYPPEDSYKITDSLMINNLISLVNEPDLYT